MADLNKFENMLEKLVNEDRAGAEELFHEIVVEKSREIYENLLENDLEETDKEVEESACNERIITTLTNIVASFVVHRISDFASYERRGKHDTLTPSKSLFSLTTGLHTYDI